MPLRSNESSSRDTLDTVATSEERRRTGRYVAGGAVLAIMLLAVHHALLREASTIAGVSIPAIIMVCYIIWILYSAHRDRRKALRFATAMQLTEVISVPASSNEMICRNGTGKNEVGNQEQWCIEPRPRDNLSEDRMEIPSRRRKSTTVSVNLSNNPSSLDCGFRGSRELAMKISRPGLHPSLRTNRPNTVASCGREGRKVTRAQTPTESIEDSTRHGAEVPDRASSSATLCSSSNESVYLGHDPRSLASFDRTYRTHHRLLLNSLRATHPSGRTKPPHRRTRGTGGSTRGRFPALRIFTRFSPVNRAIALFFFSQKLASRFTSAQMMKGRHQFRRRFSLQPSSLKEGQEDGTTKNIRNERLSESDSGGGKQVESSIRHKIVVMGAAKVGKSAIINQFLYNTFTPKYKRTVEEMHHGDFNVSGIHLTLDILDTSGSYEFPAMRDLSIKSADAFILVYDIHDANTFLEVKTLRTQILNTKGAVPIVVVGNKVDVTDSAQEVDTDSTRELVIVKWENGFVEVSAKENLNISQVFKELLIQAKLKYNLSPALRRRRRQSLPPPQHLNSRSSSAHVPSPAQLQHLQQIRERSESKRNSCILS